MNQVRTEINSGTFNQIRELYNVTGKFDTEFKDSEDYLAHYIYTHTTRYKRLIGREVKQCLQ